MGSDGFWIINEEAKLGRHEMEGVDMGGNQGGDECNQITTYEIPKELIKINPLKFIKTQSFIISE